jgi:hypothetical protein
MPFTHAVPIAQERALGYRLKQWPHLPEECRKAGVLRVLSRMSIGPVTHGWFLRHCGLRPRQAAHLLEQLVAADTVHVIAFDWGAPSGAAE